MGEQDEDDILDGGVMGLMSAPWFVSPLNVARYNKLDMNVQPRSVVSPKVCNKKVNRYLDVLPNPNTRVKLSGRDGEDPEISTYYNANYVHDATDSNDKGYICAMGPLPECVDNFWRMVWDNNVPSIVMATKLVEKQRNKCERYWPPKKGKTGKYSGGEIAVTLVDEKAGEGYSVSTLKIAKGKEKRQLMHYWFTSWPDHGVPTKEDGSLDAGPVVSMMREFRQHRATTIVKGPPIIHCSAGVGRAGTLIALDSCMDMLEKKNKVDPVEMVQHIRKDRVALVQHMQQYQLLHASCIHFAEVEGRKVVVSDAGQANLPWHHGELSKEDSEKRMAEFPDAEDGDYFACSRAELYKHRPNDSNDYVLVIAFRGQATQHLVAKRPDGIVTINNKAYGENKSLEELVETLQGDVPGWPVKLNKPILAPNAESGFADSPRKGHVPGHDEEEDAEDQYIALQGQNGIIEPTKEVEAAAVHQPEYVHGFMTKEEADEIMNRCGEQDGDFFLSRREDLYTHRASNDDDYVLCLRFKGQPTQHLICRRDDGLFVVNNEQFGENKSVISLITLLHTPIPGWPLPLKTGITPAMNEEKKNQPAPEPEPVVEPEPVKVEPPKQPEPEPEPEPEVKKEDPVSTSNATSRTASTTSDLSRKQSKNSPPFFHGIITQAEANTRVISKGKIDGDFLLYTRPDIFKNRETTPNDFILAVVFRGNPTQHIITKNPQGMMTVNNTQFGNAKTLKDLITVLSQDGTPGWPAQLKRPVFRPDFQPRKRPEWFHGTTSKEQADANIRAYSPEDGTFLFCERPNLFTSRPNRAGDCVLAVMLNGEVSQHLVTKEGQNFLVNNVAYGNNDSLEELVEALKKPQPNWPVVLTDGVPAGKVSALSTVDTTSPVKRMASDFPPKPLPLYFHGQMTKEQAAACLSVGGIVEGKFLMCLRDNLYPNKDNGPYDSILCVAYQGMATQHIVSKNENGHFTVNGVSYGEKSDIDDMIQYLSQPNVPGWPVPLTKYTISPLAERENAEAKESGDLYTPGLSDNEENQDDGYIEPVRATENKKRMKESKKEKKKLEKQMSKRMSKRKKEGKPEWWHPETNRVQADQRLLVNGAKDGMWFVCDRSNLFKSRKNEKDDCVLCVVYMGQPTQHVISHDPKTKAISINGLQYPKFKTVPQVVEGLKKPGVPNWPIQLQDSIMYDPLASIQTPTHVTTVTSPNGRPVWYHGEVSRLEANELLLSVSNPPVDGTFFVCDRQNLFKERPNKDGDCVLCVVYANTPTQHVVSKNPNGAFVVNGVQYGNCSTINELVETLSTPGASQWPVDLKKPITIDDAKKKTSPIWLHDDLSRPEADALLMMAPVEDGKFFVCKREKLFKDRPNGPKDCVLCVVFAKQPTQHIVSQSDQTGYLLLNGMDFGEVTTIEELVKKLSMPGVPNWPVVLTTPVLRGTTIAKPGAAPKPMQEEEEEDETPDWFHGKLDDEEAKELLMRFGVQEGKFLVCLQNRKIAMKTKEVLVLWLIYHGKPVSYLLTQMADGNVTVNGSLYGDCKSVEELIEHLSKPALSGWPVRLTLGVPVGGVAPDKPVQVVPSEVIRPTYYHGKLSVQQSNELLLADGLTEGKFLFCDRDNLYKDHPNGPEDCVLAVVHNSEPTQHLVTRWKDGTFAVGNKSYGHNYSIAELYRSLREGGHGWKARLRHPINREQPAYYHGFLTKAVAEGKMQHRPSGSYLVCLHENPSKSKKGNAASYRDVCALYVMDKKETKSYFVARDADGWLGLAGTTYQGIRTIEELVERLSQADPGFPIVLKEPISASDVYTPVEHKTPVKRRAASQAVVETMAQISHEEAISAMGEGSAIENEALREAQQTLDDLVNEQRHQQQIVQEKSRKVAALEGDLQRKSAIVIRAQEDARNKRENQASEQVALEARLANERMETLTKLIGFTSSATQRTLLESSMKPSQIPSVTAVPFANPSQDIKASDVLSTEQALATIYALALFTQA